MAPITRRSQANAGVMKKVHRKRDTAPAAAKRQASDSWELLDRQGLNAEHEESAEPEEETNSGQLALRDSMDVQEVIGPLRQVADRIGHEVEAFAQTLDQWLDGFDPSASATIRFESALHLVHDLGAQMEQTVEQMDRDQKLDRALKARKDWAAQSVLPNTSTALEPSHSLKGSVLGEKRKAAVMELEELREEADLWDLLWKTLDLNPFEAEAATERAEKRAKLDNLGPAHLYTSEDDMWERFELCNDAAVSRRMVKKWFEMRADGQGADMKDMVDELERRAGRGKGLWRSGWMHTREKIKGEKRLRQWPVDADISPPEIRRSCGDDLLVSRLDPDAVIRQERTVEKPDVYFERATWITFWEMLRRGMSGKEIAKWCADHGEDWRAMSVGVTMDSNAPAVARAVWRHLCRSTAESGTTSDHEAAVFALLGGSEGPAANVARTTDDRFYAFYNAKLLRAFDSFVLSQCPNASGLKSLRGLADHQETKAQAEQATVDFLARLRKEASTKDEMLTPMKVIQAYILTDEITSLINTVGMVIGETARAQGAEGVIFFRSERDINPNDYSGEREVALDPQALRMLAHMSIVCRSLAMPTGADLMEDDNVLVAYIQALRVAGKRDLIPIYASQLRRKTSTVVLARVLQDVMDGDEQNRMLKLLQDYGLDVITILEEHLSLILKKWFVLDSEESTFQPFRMLETTVETKLHPGQRIIVGCLSDEISQADDALVAALKWFQICTKHWTVTFNALTKALLRCLILGNLTAARHIVQSLPYEDVCQAKTFEITGVAVNIMDEQAPPPQSKEEQLTRDLFKRQSRTYYELVLLVHAIEALAEYREEEHIFLSESSTRPTSPPSALREAKRIVTNAMAPILKGILLNPRDPEEKADMNCVRQIYIPDIIIAYNTVLHGAGNLITRDCLLESMDLSVAVAQEGSGNEVGNGLLWCFKETGRLRELVSSFALTSKLMLVLKAEGKAWKPKKDRQGKDLGIWEIGAQQV